jgi:hypothetical protein
MKVRVRAFQRCRRQGLNRPARFSRATNVRCRHTCCWSPCWRLGPPRLNGLHGRYICVPGGQSHQSRVLCLNIDVDVVGCHMDPIAGLAMELLSSLSFWHISARVCLFSEVHTLQCHHLVTTSLVELPYVRLVNINTKPLIPISPEKTACTHSYGYFHSDDVLA